MATGPQRFVIGHEKFKGIFYQILPICGNFFLKKGLEKALVSNFQNWPQQLQIGHILVQIWLLGFKKFWQPYCLFSSVHLKVICWP